LDDHVKGCQVDFEPFLAISFGYFSGLQSFVNRGFEVALTMIGLQNLDAEVLALGELLCPSLWVMASAHFLLVWDARILEDIQIVFLLWSVGLRDFKGHVARFTVVSFGLSLAFPGFIVMVQIAGPANASLVRIDVVCCERICANSADVFFLHAYFTELVITGSTE
jgi:hypothetical protein